MKMYASMFHCLTREGEEPGRVFDTEAITAKIPPRTARPTTTVRLSNHSIIVSPAPAVRCLFGVSLAHAFRVRLDEVRGGLASTGKRFHRFLMEQ